MKLADVRLAARYAEILENLPDTREATSPDREPSHDWYENGVEIGYFEGDSGGGVGDTSVLLPLESSKELLDFLENLCRRRLKELGVEVDE